MKVLSPNAGSIAEAAKALSEGSLVAFPTETVYGLGANALDLSALGKLYAAKGRPTDHPVIVHLASVDQLPQWTSSIPDGAMLLAERLWPGPLTLILPKAAHVPDQVTGGQSSVGLRIPNHPIALALLREFAGGVAAPSANKFGKISPTCADDVFQGFAPDEISMILDGGACEVGIESTIVDFSGASARILRPGMILPEQIESILAECGTSLQYPQSEAGKSSHHPVTRVPGGLPSHYAPSTPLKTVATADLVSTVQGLASSGSRVCVLSFRDEDEAAVYWITAPKDPYLYARQLYRSLRKLDRLGADVIVVENVPATEPWSGVADRLQRAAHQPGDLAQPHVSPPSALT